MQKIGDRKIVWNIETIESGTVVGKFHSLPFLSFHMLSRTNTYFSHFLRIIIVGIQITPYRLTIHFLRNIMIGTQDYSVQTNYIYFFYSTPNTSLSKFGRMSVPNIGTRYMGLK